MHLILNMAKMANGEFSRGTIEKMQYLFKKPLIKVQEEMQQGVDFPWHAKEYAVIDRPWL
jgi:hypothetical protein